ncbi:hypothetical protein EMN47_01770 [Prolixibacteraceae bacterium JC049]|nr:hypothetical protein [Prolixibacteraceae bacterium JC049]
MFFIGPLASILPYILVTIIYIVGMMNGTVSFDSVGEVTDDVKVVLMGDVQTGTIHVVDTYHFEQNDKIQSFTNTDPPKEIASILNEIKHMALHLEKAYAYTPIFHISSRPPPMA